MKTTAAANDISTESLSVIERAAVIRHRMRCELEVAPRHVSVRVEKYSQGATIHVVLKSNAIRLSDVEAIANVYASSCYAVNVSYDDAALAPMVDAIVVELSVMVECGWESATYRGVECRTDGEYFYAKPTNGLDNGLRCYGMRFFARNLAIALLEGAGHGWGAFTNWDEPEAVNSQVAFLEAVGAL